MLVPRSAALLAGEVLAHAVWSVSEAPEGEVLVPLAGTLHEGKVNLIRFVPEDLSENVAVNNAQAFVWVLPPNLDAGRRRWTPGPRGGSDAY